MMGKVIGIGGIFLKFEDPKKMREWYEKVLGLTTNDYGVLFQFNHSSQQRGYLQLGTFEKSTNYFGSENQQTMINLRVDDMESMMNVLIENNVPILNELEEYEYGKFLHISDPEGNRIELWEPVDQSFTDANEPFTPMN